ncbi:DNA adenine methylase [Candidatus Margulisiibacteriota bacterium]
MNYIGSKHRLTKFITETIVSVVGDISELVFCDLFAGTGIIGRAFKSKAKKIISNDLEKYSYVLVRNYIGNYKNIYTQKYINELNLIEGRAGLIYNNYCLGSGSGRQYFTDDNGQKIDAVRQEIEQWFINKRITEDEYYFLLASLIESADKIANTASVYAAFLKHIKKAARADFKLMPATFLPTKNSHDIYNEYANKLINKISGDILYLDPPYNCRQYGNYYHILNTITEYQDILPTGITGMREYNISPYCKKNQIEAAFTELITRAKFKYIFLSYNNEGLMSAETIAEIMEKHGSYKLATQKHKRYKADKGRSYKAKETLEYLHILEKHNS